MAEEDDKFNADDWDLHDAEFEETIPWSFSYLLVCILLPMMAGGINGFAWSGFSLYVRKMGWDLPMAGLGISIGSLLRLPVQQAIFRGGIWTCVIFATLQVVVASLALAFPEQAVIIFCQAGAIAGLDVTVAVEGITFDQWSDSEAMVGQAQSTVLSVFTISYATAATLGGVIYDSAGWTGMSAFHTVCAAGQLLVLVVQPIMRQSFKEFLYGVQEEEVDPLDLTTVVPIATGAPDSGATGVTHAIELPPAAALEIVVLPGALEDVPSPASPVRPVTSEQGGEGPAETPIREFSGGASPSRPRGERERRSTVRSVKSVKSVQARDRAGSGGSNLIMRGFVGRDSYASRPSASRKSGVSHRSGVSHGSGLSDQTQKSSATKASRITGRSARTAKTHQSGRTLLSSLSRFTSLSQAGENFQYNYGVTNGLRPHIVGVDYRDDSEEEEEKTSGRKSEVGEVTGEVGEVTGEVTAERKSRKTVEKKRLPRDMYLVAFLVAMCSFNTNTSYAIEWATFAIFFQEQHNWTSATWAGICQTSGDLLAALMMGIFKGGERKDLGELTGVRWLWHAATGQPYNLVVLCCLWVLLNAGLCAPALPLAIASQVIMGTVYVFSVKAVTDLNLFYSLGESQIFMQLQVQCRNADAIGAVISGYVALQLYDMFPLAPFLLSTGISLVSAIIITVGFCRRVGFGQDIETAEARRARRLGSKRVSTWKSQRSKGGD